MRSYSRNVLADIDFEGAPECVHFENGPDNSNRSIRHAGAHKNLRISGMVPLACVFQSGPFVDLPHLRSAVDHHLRAIFWNVLNDTFIVARAFKNNVNESANQHGTFNVESRLSMRVVEVDRGQKFFFDGQMALRRQHVLIEIRGLVGVGFRLIVRHKVDEIVRIALVRHSTVEVEENAMGSRRAGLCV